jgi:hypothetical protein
LTRPLPAILAGPIVGRVERSSVSVWVARQREATLKLTGS